MADGKIGRPTKLTPSAIVTLQESITRGLTYDLAARRVGVSYEALRQWMRQGEADLEAGDTGTVHAQLVACLTEAESESAASLLESLTESDDWRAKAWLLERRFPAQYGRKTELTHTVTTSLRQQQEQQLKAAIIEQLIADGVIDGDRLRIIDAEIVSQHIEAPPLLAAPGDAGD